MQKKVTLSLNSGVYRDFQSFCELRALLISKKVELIMRDVMSNRLKTSLVSNAKYSKAKQQKATLSIDSKIYSDFQKYCEENAIMLSKKIELIMAGIMEDKR